MPSLVKAVKRAGYSVRIYEDGSGLWGIWRGDQRATSSAYERISDAYAECLGWMVEEELTPPSHFL